MDMYNFDDTFRILRFRCLGIADDGQYYFISSAKRLEHTKQITKGFLLKLESILMLAKVFGHDDKLTAGAWDKAIDFVIRASEEIDFDSDNVRGRGAWREKDGRICYHDGKITSGDYDPERIYLRKPQKKIGIDKTPATKEEVQALYDITKEFTFKNDSDAKRLLGFAFLAPFAGAYDVRPAVMLTGDSGTGKSWLVKNIVTPIARQSSFAYGTTIAGIMGYNGADSGCIFIEEADNARNDKKNMKGVTREDYFDLMRCSSGKDDPDLVKGTKDQGYTSYKMNSMFCFNAINNMIDNEADKNRIVQIDLVKASSTGKDLTFTDNKNKLQQTLTFELSEKIRALIWENIDVIIKISDRIADISNQKYKLSLRRAHTEGMLLAAFTVATNQLDEYTDEFLLSKIDEYYQGAEFYKDKDEPSEAVDRLLHSLVKFSCDEVQKEFTIREMVEICFSEKIKSMKDIDGKLTESERAIKASELHDIKRALKNRGIAYKRVTTEKGTHEFIALMKRHAEISKMLGLGSDRYEDFLIRHKGYYNKAAENQVYFDGRTHRCILIKYE